MHNSNCILVKKYNNHYIIQWTASRMRLLARQSSGEGCYFPLPSSGSFSVSQALYSSPRVWGFEVSLLRLCHCQVVLTGHRCQLLEDKDLWLPLSSAFPWPSAPPASVCSATSPHRILFSAVGLGKFVTSISIGSISKQLKLLYKPAVIHASFNSNGPKAVFVCT